MGVIRGRVGKADYAAAMWLASGKWRARLVPAAVICFVGYLVFAVFGQPLDPLLVVLLGAVGVVVAIGMHWIAVETSYRANPALGPEFELDWDDDGMTIAGATGRTLYAWEEIARASEDDRSLLIYVDARNMIVVPKRLFAQARLPADLRAIMRRHGIPGASRANVR